MKVKSDNSELCDNKNKENDDLEEDKMEEEEEKLVVLLEQRLQFLLRSLAKLCLSKNSGANKKELVSGLKIAH